MQLMDLSVKKCAKDYLKKEFHEWYAAEVAVCPTDGSDCVNVDLSLSRMKPSGFKWLVELYDYLCGKPDLLSIVLKSMEFLMFVNIK